MVHEDHDMMGAFNVTYLSNLGYTETDLLIDPMEPRWRAKPYSSTNIAQVQSTVLPEFAATNAYKNLDQIQVALNQYHGYAKREAYETSVAKRRGRKVRRAVKEEKA